MAGAMAGAMAILALLAHAETNDERSIYKLPSTQPVIIDHCFYRDMRYFPTLPNLPTQQSTIGACQALCALEPECRYISWWGSGHCVLSGEGAYMVQDLYATAGPKHCTEVLASCRERPSARFPGMTPIASAQAWPSGWVPFPMECWPQAGRLLERCEKQQVLQSPGDGAFNCDNLVLTPVPLYETCHSHCGKQPLCSIYVENATGCFLGRSTAGFNCFSKSPRRPIRAGRLLHGEVRVLVDLRQSRVLGLTKVFKEEDLIGNPRSVGVEGCRASCYSSLNCRYWQYLLGQGCWLEEPGRNVLFPLTDGNVYRDFSIAIAGEYIQHFCPGLGWTPSEEWILVAQDTGCVNSSSVKDLGEAGILQCQKLAASEGCAGTIFGDGQRCFCMTSGLCERRHQANFQLYERKDLVEVSPVAENDAYLRKVPADVQGVHVEVALKGVSYDSVEASTSTQLELLRSQLAEAVAGATGARASTIWDDSGHTRKVDLKPGSFGEELRVEFNMERPRSSDELTRSLGSHELQESMRKAVYALSPESITGPVKATVSYGPEDVGHAPLWWLPAMLIGLCFVLMLTFVCILNAKGIRMEQTACDASVCENPLDGLCDSDPRGETYQYH
ncbi:Hypothetical protein SCF082_LOCUS19678 [Durusdinium trenchii]|uniref:Apple domain-containing protein n=1 Tax=Durusdinium trenchii TaxID=1381693 RepID=A0ABP0KXT2_9DINO